MSKSGVVFLTHSVVVFGDKELPVRFIHRVTDIPVISVHFYANAR